MMDAHATAVKTLFESLPPDELMRPEGYPPAFLRSLLRADALRPLCADDTPAGERLGIIRQAAYASVEVALSMGITVTLFCDPVRRFAPDLWNADMKQGFQTGGLLGGMMITEPGFGTDMRACGTTCRAVEGGYELRGTKHWAGLTGLADFWLVLARDDEPGSKAGFPSLNFYVCRADPESFRVVRRYASAGLRSIPYGMTRIEATAGVLGPLLTGNRVERFRRIHGILHRSRISIAAIAHGACERLAEEAIRHVRERVVFGRPLREFGQVQARMAEIEAAREVAGVLHGVARRHAVAADTTGGEVDGMTANAVKVVASDLAFAAATSASQLLGGESYRTDTYIGRATADLRPFRIFEGSNDVLCDAVWQAVEKSARTGGDTFADIVREAFERAELPPPDTHPFAPAEGATLPQGLRCLGGRVLAHAAALRWCLDDGLAPKACRPLAARMDRDLHAAWTWGDEAGLQEY